MYKCKQCDTVCETADHFRKHFTQHLEPHQQNVKTYRIKLEEHSTYVYHCKLCKKNLDENEYKRHSEKHGNEVCKICDTCGKVFTLYGSWYTHQQIHIAEKSDNKFVCKICGKSFTLASLLRVHMRVHSKDRPHVCEICGKRFKTNRSLVRHRLTHSDVKPLSCEFCGKGFTCAYNLNAHLRTHTGEKPYKCDVCNAAFTHNVSLKTHKRSAHGIDMWKGQIPPGSQEVDNINIKDPEFYKLREKDASGLQSSLAQESKPSETSDSYTQESKPSETSDTYTQENKPSETFDTYTKEGKATQSSDIKEQPSKISATTGNLQVSSSEESGHMLDATAQCPTSSKAQFKHPSASDSDNKGHLFKKDEILSSSSNSYVSVPIRAPDSSRMQMASYLQPQSNIPNYPPVSSHTGLYLPFLGFPEMADNSHQNVQPPHAHSVHAASHGNVDFDLMHASQTQRTGNRWTNEAPARQFTDL